MYGNILFPTESKSKQNNKPTRKNAVSRLMRDLKEWEKCQKEFPCIAACPLDDNIMEWHCNICPNSGDFANIIFHLIITFDETYPVRAPNVRLCTTIPHPNVFGGWICLDMIKRYDVGRYKGWTPAYSVTSILMQLQSFLFEQTEIDQMDYDGSRERRFNQETFDRYYLPSIKSFHCKKCHHCWTKPFPITPTMVKKTKTQRRRKNAKKRRNNNFVNDKQNPEFSFWDGIYRDLEITIFAFFNVQDLLKLRRVAKRFQTLVFNTKIIQKDSIKCWFHRSSTLTLTSKNGETENTKMLCLGYGVNPHYFENDRPSTLSQQIFGSLENGAGKIEEQIGEYEMISSIDTTFDLLSSDAFENFEIRKTVFNDRQFTHFIPLYINEKHGKMAIKKMDTYIPKLWKYTHYLKTNQNKCHPWLKLLTIANCMKSLIVSVMQDSENNQGNVSLHYSINVLETFFRLHHTLLAIYFHYKNVIGALLQEQIELFFECDSCGNYTYRNKWNIPDLGVFLAYITLWENPNNIKWKDIGYGLLCETMTRQVKWVLNKHEYLVRENGVPLMARAKLTWESAQVSNRLFMFNTFFFKKCCCLGEKTLQKQFEEYNLNFGFPKNESLAIRLQKFVKSIHFKVKDYRTFFQKIGLPYPGSMTKVGKLLVKCLNTSENRGYHKPYYYGYVTAPQHIIQQEKEPEELGTSFKLKTKRSSKPFKWGQQKKPSLAAKLQVKTTKSTIQPQNQSHRAPAQPKNVSQTRATSVTPQTQQTQQTQKIPRVAQRIVSTPAMTRQEAPQSATQRRVVPAQTIRAEEHQLQQSVVAQIPQKRVTPTIQTIVTPPRKNNFQDGRQMTCIQPNVQLSTPHSMVSPPQRSVGNVAHGGYGYDGHFVNVQRYEATAIPFPQMTPQMTTPQIVTPQIAYHMTQRPVSNGHYGYHTNGYYNSNGSYMGHGGMQPTQLNYFGSSHDQHQHQHQHHDRENEINFSNGNEYYDENETSIVSTCNSFAASEASDGTTTLSTTTLTPSKHGMFNGAKPKRPPTRQNGELLNSILNEKKTYGPKPVGHGMHNGKKPKRPPMLMSWLDVKHGDNDDGNETTQHSNDNNKENNDGNIVVIQKRRRRHRGKRRKTGNKL